MSDLVFIILGPFLQITNIDRLIAKVIKSEIQSESSKSVIMDQLFLVHTIYNNTKTTL